jgi:hypothetical protein
MALQEMTRKVLSYCDIPEEIDKDILDEAGCDVYVEYTADEDSELDNWILENYPELEGIKFLIHIDY